MRNIGKNAFLDILTRHIKEPFGDYVTMLMLESCNWEETDGEVILSIDKVLLSLGKMMTGLPLR